MKKLLTTFKILSMVILSITGLNAQNVGINTATPDAPFHVSSSGQVHTNGGLMLLGNRSEVHMELDFNRIQSLSTQQANPISLLLQPDGGNVGIGISNPTVKMHIQGSGNQYLTLHKTNNGPGEVGINLLRGTGVFDTDWRVVNDEGTFRILSNNDNFLTSGSEALNINSVGKVTIGAATSTSQLNVNGTTNISLSNYGDFTIGDSAGANVSFDDNEVFCRNGVNPATFFMQRFGGNLSLCFDADGKVGIGTTIPEVKLQIVGGTDLNLASGGQLLLGSSTGPNLGLDNNEIMARNNGAVAPLYIQGNGGDVMIIPNEGGQVGIGITSVAFLPAGYMLAVDGKIISEEVRVEMSGAWPDYVFKSDYQLTPLDILESKIKEKGHLPGIPSAAEVEANGIELGDMQKRMMEKVEELTLYVIELKKEIDALKNERL